MPSSRDKERIHRVVEKEANDGFVTRYEHQQALSHLQGGIRVEIQAAMADLTKVVKSLRDRMETLDTQLVEDVESLTKKIAVAVGPGIETVECVGRLHKDNRDIKKKLLKLTREHGTLYTAVTNIAGMSTDALGSPEMDSLAGLPAESIIEGVCKRYGIDRVTLLGSSRAQGTVKARQMLMFLLYRKGISLKEVGLIVGGKDHSTVIHNIRNLEFVKAGIQATPAQVRAWAEEGESKDG